MSVAEVFPFLVALCAIGGIVVGSFLNVVIYRVPLGQSIVSPGSTCPGCGTALAIRDNVPVVSWLALRGRCRTCSSAISIRYPAVEMITGLLFGLMAVRFGATWSLPAELALVGGLVALAAVDLERYLLPRAIVYPTAILVLLGIVVAAALYAEWERLAVALACSAGAFLVFYAIHVARPGWMGFGDVRLAALLGLGLGWIGPLYVVVALVMANVAGTVIGVGLMAGGRANRNTRFPYGAFLAAGSLFALLLGAQFIAWYHLHVVA